MRNYKYTHQQLQQEEQLQQHEQHHHQQRSRFLPMLCSSSTKQVIKFSVSQRRCSSTTSSSSPSCSTVSDDPLSPRVGCMGQVKRNNKVVGFPKTISNTTNNATTITSGCTSIKSHDQISKYTNNSIITYYKLKRFFSTTSSPTTATFTAAAARSGTHKGGRNHKHNNNNNRGMRANSTALRDDHGARSKIDENCVGAIVSTNRKKINSYENGHGSFVNLMDLDPPLPVVKQPRPQQEQKQGDDGEENSSLWKRRSRGAPLKSLQVQTAQHSCNLSIQPTTV